MEQRDIAIVDETPSLTVMATPSPMMKWGMFAFALVSIGFGTLMLNPSEPGSSPGKAALGFGFGLFLFWAWLQSAVFRQPRIYLFSDRVAMSLWSGRTLDVELKKYGLVRFTKADLAGVKQQYLCFFSWVTVEALAAVGAIDEPDPVTADLALVVNGIFGKRTLSGEDFAIAVQSQLELLRPSEVESADKSAMHGATLHKHRRRKLTRSALFAAAPVAAAALSLLTMEEPSWLVILFALVAAGLIFLGTYWWADRRTRG